jgi:hypothetical protein
MPTKTNHRPAVLMALAASAGLTVLIIVGSRNLEHYDAALFGYTVASVVAFGAVVFRYAIASGICFVVTLTLIFWWRPASRRFTSSGYLKR